MPARKLSEHVEDELFNKEKRATTPKIVKEPVSGDSEVKPVKKKKPYYRKKYNKPTPVEVIPEPIVDPVKNYGFFVGVLVGVIAASIIETIINLLN